MIKPVVSFEPERHLYAVQDTPIVVPRVVRSVTQVLEDAGISDWSGVPDDILWAAQQRGTMAHRACHYINKGTLDPSTVDEAIGGYVEGWQKFRRDHGFTPTVSEHLVYRRITIDDKEVIRPAATDLEIIGQLDTYGYIATKKVGDTLIDIKTGDPTDSWAPQTAAYARAYSVKARFTAKRLVVQLKKTGDYRLHWMPIRFFDADWEVFRRALMECKRAQMAAELQQQTA